MSHPDTLSDTTPVVINFVNDLAAARTSSGSDYGAQQDRRLRPGCQPVMGNVFLTSLPSLSRLARKRQLLLQTVKSPVSSSCPSAPATARNAVFVRMVLSLRGGAKKEAAMATRAPVSGDGEASQQTEPLPWWTSSSASNESAQDVVYDVQCMSDTDVRNQERVSGGNHVVLTAIPCRIVLRSKPVPVLSSALVHELALDAQLCATAASGSDDHARTRDTNKSEDVGAEAVSGSCVARALKAFDACVNHHERACLCQIADVVESLQRLLEQPDTEIRGTGERAGEDLSSQGPNDDASRLGSSVSPLHEWTIDVPIYGVVICIEDTQATRLERVRRLTTPLMKAATGCSNAAGGPLGPVTQALAKLHTWCTASTALASVTQSASLSTPAPTPELRPLTSSQVAELHQLVVGHLENPQAHTPSLQESGYSAAVNNSTPRALPAPACIVHCQLGVSRSPSVVMLFYMDVFVTQLRMAVSAAAAPMEIFYGLQNALVQARHRVQPNVCFAAQLLSLWNKLMHPNTPIETT
ncbi:hypothetical protein JKF63_06266 [Porcisia hertigi]|uniref:Uncharacterized protein n=1 Tax=Porcisia hertigi TaxID=2761500 RepID=A0A836IX14_9TRYP|nr:hypothetical protein JKF63_06266 [Porcisia hertigi]